MKSRAILPLVFLSFTLNAFALSPATKTAADEFVKALKEEVQAMPDEPNARQLSNRLAFMIQNLQSGLDSMSETSLSQLLREYESYIKSEKSQSSLIKLKGAIRSSLMERQDGQLHQLESQFEKAKETVLNAKTPADLDDLIGQLSMRDSNNSYREEGMVDQDKAQKIRQLQNQISYVKGFVIMWQNYLQAKQDGNVSSMNQAIQNLQNQENSLIPRSILLQLKPAEKTKDRGNKADDVALVLSNIKSLDDIQAALGRLSFASV